MVQTLQEHSQFNLGHASSLRTLQAAKILPSKRYKARVGVGLSLHFLFEFCLI